MDDSLPPNWRAATDPRSGRTYYYNSKTKERSWKHPSLLEQPAQEQTVSEPAYQEQSYASASAESYQEQQTYADSQYQEQQSADQYQEQYQEQQPATDSYQEDPLPAGWEARVDKKSGRTYYVNKELHQSVWTRPTADASAARPAPAQRSKIVTSGTAVPRPNVVQPEVSGNVTSTTSLLPDTVTTGGSRAPETAKHVPQTASAATLLAKSDVLAGPLHSLPPELKNSIHNFQMSGFAKEHFAKHKKGFLFIKKPISLEVMMSFQTDPLDKPLLKSVEHANKKTVKEAVTNFEEILVYTGVNSKKANAFAMNQSGIRIANRGANIPELRDEIYIQLIKQTTPNPSFNETLNIYLNLQCIREGRQRTKEEREQARTKRAAREHDAKSREKKEKEEQKQMNAIIRGWQLINLCCDTFQPSRDFERTLLKHIDDCMVVTDQGLEEEDKPQPAEPADDSKKKKKKKTLDTAQLSSFTKELIQFIQTTSTLAQYALNRLQSIALFGGQGKTLSNIKIDQTALESAAELTNTKRVFGCHLNEILMRQQQPNIFSYSSSTIPQQFTPTSVNSERDFTVPVVMVYLCMSMCAENRLHVEGVFRKCITIDETDHTINKLNNGEYSLESSNAHTYAVLLKTWLKRLTAPIVPFSLYNKAIEVANDPSETIDFVLNELPRPNVLLLKYLCRFLRVVCHSEFVDDNKMNASNLALIFAPTLIHMDTDKTAESIKNLKLEIQFIFFLIVGLVQTEEEERNFADSDQFIIERCHLKVDPQVRELLWSAGKEDPDDE